MRDLPDDCIAAIITSPPYWNIVDYDAPGQIGVGQTYEQYLEAMLEVWRQAERVLIPNGKLAVVTPVMPIRKDVIADQHTRHLKNIGSDIEQTILASLGLRRFGLFVWQKQTTTKMFGSYPYPPNIYEDNTIEFIHVFVKDGPPPPPPVGAKEFSKISQEEWRNLTMQVWSMYPADVQRAQHPAPFPVVLPQRLIKMYTFAENPDTGFAGDIVLDMFNGSGSTCVAARAMRRNWIGIDLGREYCAIARRRIRDERVNPTEFMLEWPRVRKASDSQAIQMGLFLRRTWALRRRLQFNRSLQSAMTQRRNLRVRRRVLVADGAFKKGEAVWHPAHGDGVVVGFEGLHPVVSFAAGATVTIAATSTKLRRSQIVAASDKNVAAALARLQQSRQRAGLGQSAPSLHIATDAALEAMAETRFSRSRSWARCQESGLSAWLATGSRSSIACVSKREDAEEEGYVPAVRNYIE